MTTTLQMTLARYCLLLVMLFSAWQVQALQAIPALAGSVTDTTNTLSSQEQAALSNKLTQFAKEKGSQVAVLIVPTTNPEAIEQYSIRVADAWKLGREKEDDGVLVVVATQDRKMRIEVGYGLEGAIPDAYAKRIVSEQLRPYFRRGQFYAGLDAATNSIAGLIEGEDLPPPQVLHTDGKSLFELLPLIMFVAIITGTILRSMFGTFLGSLFNGGLIGGLVLLFGAVMATAALVAIVGFIFTLMMGSRGVNGYGNYPHHPGGYGGGGFGNGGFGGGDIFSGGGGGFGGGGASGSW